MFCPNCGKSDQQQNSYCRQCGEYLPELSKKKKQFSIGGDTPEEQINTNLYLNLLGAVVSLALAIALYVTFYGQTAAPVIYLTAAFLLAMSGWQLSTFYIGLKLKKNFSRRRENTADEESKPVQSQFESAKTKQMLNEADYENIVPVSVTENTTRHLTEKVKNKSTQSEH